MCGCDDNAPSAYREQDRRAAKAHRCCECGQTIAQGDHYKYISGVWDHQPASYKTCWPCVAFRNRDRRLNAGQRGYCGPCIGQLYEDCPREELPLHVRSIAA